MDLKKIGAYIAGKRKALGMTQRELADRLNMSDKSISKWERGICLPDVSVYLKLCEILGITVNEFLAGEDIEVENMPEKSESNIMGVALDSSRKQKKLKRIIAVLAAITLTTCICGAAFGIYYNFIRPQNYVAPMGSDSVEMQTAEILSGMNSVLLYEFKNRDEYGGLTVYMSEYRNGELVDKSDICDIHSAEWDKIGSEGVFAVLIDDSSSSVTFTAAWDDYQEAVQVPISAEDYMGMSMGSIEEELEIEPGKEQGIGAVFFDNDEMRHLPVSMIASEKGGVENDLVYYFSVEFNVE